MKWRPISELSDEQRDGRWWLFAWHDNEGHEEVLLRFEDTYWVRCNRSQWSDDGEDPKTSPISDTKGFFCSEPVPDFPKPMKMEWRRFEDNEVPLGYDILLRTEDGTIHRITYGCVEFATSKRLCGNKKTHWMPIIPPEET